MAPVPTSPSASALTLLLHHSTSRDNTHQNPRRYQTISIPATAYGHPASSPGAVAGIVLAVVGGTLLIIYLVYFSFIYPQRRRTAVVRDSHGDMAEVREERGWGRGDGGDGGPDFVDVIEESSSEGNRRRPQRRRRGGARNFWGGSESAGTRSSFDDRDRGHTVEVMEEPDPPAPDPPRRKKTRKSKRRGGRRGGSSDDPFGID